MLLKPPSSARAHSDSNRQEILSSQVRLLYANANAGVGVTVVTTTILSGLEWGTVSNRAIVGWWIYMMLMSVSRYMLARRYRRASPGDGDAPQWLTKFVVGTGLSGAGWGAAGILLYPESYLTNQVFLIFVLGGMMLGAASLLAPRREAYLTFLIPTGLGPALRLLAQGDETHSAMGLLAAVFTLAIVVTTSRISRTVESSLRLQFANRDLLEDLHAAKQQTEALNQVLDIRVQERTAELRQSTDQLRAEIAQREQMEEDLLRARKLESLGVLAGGIAHDFNNFLAIVQGNIELIQSHLTPGDSIQAVLDQTAAACQRAAFLSSQLLTFAKGGIPVRRVVSVAKLVMDAVHLARAGAPISISVNLAEDLRSAKVDPGQMGQVLHNILLNARQAMPEGGIIEVHAENIAMANGPATDSGVRISIQDYGCGIPVDVLPRIFDPYFTTKPNGSGLGLATAYAIVAKHGGHISVESEPGKGTRFSIDLPSTGERPAREPVAATRPQGGTGRILVMDDEDAIRTLLTNVLSRLGYEVQTARDGAAAIALFEEARAAGKGFDAVLLDLTVSGGMGGIEAASRLRALEPSAKLIVSSGYSDAPVMSNLARYGFDGMIPKPWTTTEVSEAIRKALVAEPDRRTVESEND